METESNQLQKLQNALVMMDTVCPITMDDFSESDPPYRLNSCGHWLSLKALKALPRFKDDHHNLPCAFGICPLCKTRYTFAVLDTIGLAFLKLRASLKAPTSDSSAESSFNRYIYPPQAIIYAPHKGILDIFKDFGCL